MRLWVYKVRNDPDTQFNAWGDWESVFKEPWRPHAWGGAWASRRESDKRIFEEQIAVGDVVLAWQSDESAAIGLCEVTGRRRSKHGGSDLMLKAVERFPRPVKLHALKKTTRPELKDVVALKQGHIRTIYPTSAKEAGLLLEACGISRRVERQSALLPK